MKPTLFPCKKCRRPTSNTNRYCDQHQSDYKPPQQRYDDYRESPSKRGYDAAWRRFREVFIAMYPLCEICAQNGRVTQTEEVHHIVPLSEGGTRLDPENCQALCKACHSTLTAAWRGSK